MNSSVTAINKIGWTGNDGATRHLAQPSEDCEDVKTFTRRRTSLTTSTTTSAPIDESLDVLFTVSKLSYLSLPAPVKDIVFFAGFGPENTWFLFTRT